MICHYCQKPIGRTQGRKKLQSRLTDRETGKSYPFLEPINFHAKCFIENRASLKAKINFLEEKGVKVIL